MEDEKLIELDSLTNVWTFSSGLVKSTLNVEFVKSILKDDSELFYKVQCTYKSHKVELCDYKMTLYALVNMVTSLPLILLLWTMSSVQDCPASGGLESQRRLINMHYTAENHRGL